MQGSSSDNQIHILIVEDDIDDYVLTLDYLSELSFLCIKTDHAKSAAEAFEKMDRHFYDLCLLDYRLGAINGLEVLKHAKSIGFTAPIIMLTGMSESKIDSLALDAGAADYLVKSDLNSERFGRAIRYALARREIESEKIQRLQAQAENEAKDRFLAHLSHELRTPLSAILGYTELLLLNDQAQDVRNDLQIIQRNGQHLHNLLNDVLDLSKIVANKLELHLAEVHLADLLSDIVVMMRVVAEDKGLELRLNLEEELPEIIKSDETRLRQILLNVVGNAIKFTREGWVEISARVHENDGVEELCFSIKDTGIGIEEDCKTEIFNPFSQLGDVVSKSIGGCGLGLAISSELAMKLGGRITVDSTPNEGSTFNIFIHPGDITDQERTQLVVSERNSEEQITSNRTPLKGRVLVVDDLRDIRMLVGNIVSSSGATVSYAENGKVALDMLALAERRKQPFDVVLMDVHMPVLDGKSAVKHLRELGDKMPVVAVTAAAMKGSQQKLLDAGFTAVMSKPIDSAKLLDMLAEYLKVDEDKQKSLVAKNAARRLASARQMGTKLDSQSEYKYDSNLLAEENQHGSSTVSQPEGQGAQRVEAADDCPVLVVEDDEDSARVMKMLLDKFGGQTVTCSNGEDALKLANDRQWAAIIVDKNLPGMNGLELLSRIEEKDESVFKVVLSGESLTGENIREAGADRFVQKPIGADQLRELMQDIDCLVKSKKQH